MSLGKKVYIDSKNKILNQSQNNFGFKKAYFLGRPNSGSYVQTLKAPPPLDLPFGKRPGLKTVYELFFTAPSVEYCQ